MSVSFLFRRRGLGKTSCQEISAKSTQGIQVIRNDSRIPETDGFVFRWGCTSNLPGNPKVINRAEAIHGVNDKAGFRMVLAEAGLAPKSWDSWDRFKYERVAFNEQGWNVRFPVDGKYVVRKRTHAQGKNLHVCSSPQEVKESSVDLYGEGGYYISELIDKVAEYRVCCAFGRVAWVAKKTPGNPDDVAWNVARGGRFDNVRWDEWPLKAVKMSVQAFQLSGLDFGGVDVMVDSGGNCFVLEINSAMSLTSPYRQECTAKVFDHHVRVNSREHIPLIDELGGYRKFIHPALTQDALV